VEEIAQAAGRLQLGHIGVQIQAIDTADRERYVLADNVGDVGRHQILLGGKVDDGTPTGARRHFRRPQHCLSRDNHYDDSSV
jgi:hypothetical protein